MENTTVEQHGNEESHEKPSPPAGWQGPLVPLNVSSGGTDRRVVASRADVTKQISRNLPLPLKFQEVSAAAHDNAICGLATITQVWEQDGAVWGSGPFNLGDPRGVELANKIRDGFLGWVSVELDASQYRTVKWSDGQPVQVFDDWRIAGATLVADAAFNEARIFAVSSDESVTPSSTAVKELAGSYGLTDFAPIDYRHHGGALVTFAKHTFAEVTDSSTTFLEGARQALTSGIDAANTYLALPDDERDTQVAAIASAVVKALAKQIDAISTPSETANNGDETSRDSDRETPPAPGGTQENTTTQRENMAEQAMPPAPEESTTDTGLTDEQLNAVVERITPAVTELVTNLVQEQMGAQQQETVETMGRKREIEAIFERLAA